MIKYLIEASRKNRFLEPSEKAKYYIASKKTLANMLLHPASWVIWSAKWVNIEQTSLEHLKAIYGEIEVL